MEIDRCICVNTSFQMCKVFADSLSNPTLEDLEKELDVGCSCSLCRPYLKKMLETGQTEFNEIIEE